MTWSPKASAGGATAQEQAECDCRTPAECAEAGCKAAGRVDPDRNRGDNVLGIVIVSVVAVCAIFAALILIGCI